MTITIEINEQQLRLIRKALETEAAQRGIDLNGPREFYSGNDDHEIAILVDMARDTEQEVANSSIEKDTVQGWCL